MARKIELSWVLASIDEAREKFPFDTDLIPKSMKDNLAAILDCMVIVARVRAAEIADGEEGGDYDK